MRRMLFCVLAVSVALSAEPSPRDRTPRRYRVIVHPGEPDETIYWSAGAPYPKPSPPGPPEWCFLQERDRRPYYGLPVAVGAELCFDGTLRWRKVKIGVGKRGAERFDGPEEGN